MHRIGHVLPDRFQIMALGTQAVFEFANLQAGRKVYETENYALDDLGWNDRGD
jgi:hypothetical protein